jgi:hypothetical protein
MSDVEVVDKKKLLEWIDGMTASNNGHVPGVAIWILIRKIESGELDPDPTPSLLEEGLKQCFPGVKFVTSGEKK